MTIQGHTFLCQPFQQRNWNYAYLGHGFLIFCWSSLLDSRSYPKHKVLFLKLGGVFSLSQDCQGLAGKLCHVSIDSLLKHTLDLCYGVKLRSPLCVGMSPLPLYWSYVSFIISTCSTRQSRVFPPCQVDHQVDTSLDFVGVIAPCYSI